MTATIFVIAAIAAIVATIASIRHGIRLAHRRRTAMSAGAAVIELREQAAQRHRRDARATWAVNGALYPFRVPPGRTARPAQG